MRCIGWALAAPLLLAATGAAAEVPRVVTDIPPVHSLVARVMVGLGEPVLILPPGASPHGYAMRPSEARALEQADLVLWVGEALTPWFARAVGSLADDATSVELLEVEGVELLEFREGASFEVHDHGAEHAEDAHEDEHEAEAAGADDHDDAHGGYDSHAWLDPENAKVWLDAIAAELAAADAANAAAYAANAAAAKAEIDALSERLLVQLEPVRDRPFVVFHDAYHYFENRFGIEAAGAIALSDASDPSAARVEEIHHRMEELGAACVFSEPQFETKLLATVTEGTAAKAGTLDPVGAALDPGPGLYPQLLQDLADGLTGCLE